jgi:hypothetical protein
MRMQGRNDEANEIERRLKSVQEALEESPEESFGTDPKN